MFSLLIRSNSFPAYQHRRDGRAFCIVDLHRMLHCARAAVGGGGRLYRQGLFSFSLNEEILPCRLSYTQNTGLQSRRVTPFTYQVVAKPNYIGNTRCPVYFIYNTIPRGLLFESRSQNSSQSPLFPSRRNFLLVLISKANSSLFIPLSLSPPV